uniref:Serine/arginine repetitive matrix 4 n=2 Tax=Nothobranchius furzeri TaxID=105023 RepID=A0A1A8TYE2_NOTFU
MKTPPDRSGITFEVGAQLEARDRHKSWYAATIEKIDYDKERVLVHYRQWSRRHDEWFHWTSPYLRPLERVSLRRQCRNPSPSQTTFVSGMKVLACWTDCRFYPAKILRVNKDDSYTVRFYDGVVRTVKPTKVKPFQEKSKSEKNVGSEGWEEGESEEEEVVSEGGEEEEEGEKKREEEEEVTSEKEEAEEREEERKRKAEPSSSHPPAKKKADSSRLLGAEKQPITADSALPAVPNPAHIDKDVLLERQAHLPTTHKFSREPLYRVIKNQPPPILSIELDHNPFKCPAPDCSKSFRKASLLHYHIKYYHSDQQPDGGVEPAPARRKRSSSDGSDFTSSRKPEAQNASCRRDDGEQSIVGAEVQKEERREKPGGLDRKERKHFLQVKLKKKKKKKKSSKKSRRHRYTSKKSKRSSASLKRKRRDERRHKKSSRNRSRHRQQHRRSESHCCSCRSFTEDRHHLQRSEAHQALGELRAVEEETGAALHYEDTNWRRTTKSVCKTAPKYRSILSTGTILPLKPGSKRLNGGGSRDLSGHVEGPRDYDSGNDTSSPPSSKTGVSAPENKRGLCQRRASLPVKQTLSYKDSSSDSGNSVTSYASSCKPYEEDSFSAAVLRGNSKSSEQMTLGCQVEVVRSPKRRSRSSGRRLKSHSSSSSRSRSSGSFRHSGRYSRSPSLYSCSSYSRSLSNSSGLRRRGSLVSLSSRGSYSRCSSDRLPDRKRPPSSRQTDKKRRHKARGKRQRRKSYSPMKKRRRDSPSHLEARRITSARKRPVPYFRPSPSSSSRSTSVSSWSSLFTRSRSSSSYRSYSRSSSWNSSFGSRSRSRSRGSSRKRKKARR